MSKETKVEEESVRSEDERKNIKGMRRMSKYSEAFNMKKVIKILILE